MIASLILVIIGIAIGWLIADRVIRLRRLGRAITPPHPNVRRVERAARANRADARPAASLDSLTAANLRSTIDRYYPAANRYGTPPSLDDFDHDAPTKDIP